MGNNLALYNSLPGVRSCPGESEERLQQLIDPAEVAILFLQLTNPADKTTFALPADIMFLIFKFVGEGFSTKTQTIARADERRGSENEKRLDLCAFLAKNGKLRPPLPHNGHGRYRVREVRITCRSHDQGWSSYPQQKGRRNSHTWGEAAVTVRRQGDDRARVLEHGRSEPLYPVYRNKHACTAWEDHAAVFPHGAPLVDSVELALDELRKQQVQDMGKSTGHGGIENIRSAQTSLPLPIADIGVQLWARSQYPGWENNMEYSSIAITYELRSYDHWLASDCRSHVSGTGETVPDPR